MWLQASIVFILLILLDIPWLYGMSSITQSMYRTIQGSPLQMRIWAAIPVYVALTYLVLQQTSVIGAALAGAAVYAVYDFTTLLVFKDYRLDIAVADTVWGGILLAAVYTCKNQIAPMLYK